VNKRDKENYLLIVSGYTISDIIRKEMILSESNSIVEEKNYNIVKNITKKYVKFRSRDFIQFAVLQ